MASRISTKLASYVRLARAGDRQAITSDAARWLWSDSVAFGLARDLTRPHTPPPAKIAFDVRRLTPDLATTVFSTSGLEPADRRELANRRRLYDAGLGTAWVVVTEAGEPGYIQWTLPGSQADEIDRFFGGGFPHLCPDELLLEGAFALPAARGQRIMGEAMSRITEAGAAPEHRKAITFVGVDNEPSLRGCRSAGFVDYVERLDHWRLGRRRVRYRNLRSQPTG